MLHFGAYTHLSLNLDNYDSKHANAWCMENFTPQRFLVYWKLLYSSYLLPLMTNQVMGCKSFLHKGITIGILYTKAWMPTECFFICTTCIKHPLKHYTVLGSAYRAKGKGQNESNTILLYHTWLADCCFCVKQCFSIYFGKCQSLSNVRYEEDTYDSYKVNDYSIPQTLVWRTY